MEKERFLKTPYRRKPYMGKVMGRDSITEQTGYVPTAVLVKEMMAAGVRLRDHRREKFPAAPGVEEEPELDPTREPGFDLADAARLARKVKSGFERAREKAKEARRVLDERRKAEAAELEELRKEKEARSAEGAEVRAPKGKKVKDV